MQQYPTFPDVAQLTARVVGDHEATDSNPVTRSNIQASNPLDLKPQSVKELYYCPRIW